MEPIEYREGTGSSETKKTFSASIATLPSNDEYSDRDKKRRVAQRIRVMFPTAECTPITTGRVFWTARNVEYAVTDIDPGQVWTTVTCELKQTVSVGVQRKPG
jgi:hypothetical protein